VHVVAQQVYPGRGLPGCDALCSCRWLTTFWKRLYTEDGNLRSTDTLVVTYTTITREHVYGGENLRSGTASAVDCRLLLLFSVAVASFSLPAVAVHLHVCSLSYTVSSAVLLMERSQGLGDAVTQTCSVERRLCREDALFPSILVQRYPELLQYMAVSL
jgi:hypothetical protein